MGIAGENILSYITLIIFIGVCLSIILLLAWKFLKLAVVSFMMGCVAIYFYGLYFILINFEYYWRLLITGDQEAFWVTMCFGSVTLGILGCLIWKIRKFLVYSLLRYQFKKQAASDQEQASQNTQEE